MSLDSRDKIYSVGHWLSRKHENIQNVIFAVGEYVLCSSPKRPVWIGNVLTVFPLFLKTGKYGESWDLWQEGRGGADGKKNQFVQSRQSN